MENLVRVVASGRTAVAAAALILVLSLIPTGNWYHGLGIEGLDHYTAYTGLTFLLLFSRHNLTSWLARMGAAMTFGLFIELVQPYFHRSMELRDALANAAGIITGALLVLLLRAGLSVLQRHFAALRVANGAVALDDLTQ